MRMADLPEPDDRGWSSRAGRRPREGSGPSRPSGGDGRRDGLERDDRSIGDSPGAVRRCPCPPGPARGRSGSPAPTDAARSRFRRDGPTVGACGRAGASTRVDSISATDWADGEPGRIETAKVVRPPWMVSPSLRSTTETLRPLTTVPLRLAMSISRQQGGLTSTMKWNREKVLSFTGSRKWASFEPADDERVVLAELEDLDPRAGQRSR